MLIHHADPHDPKRPWQEKIKVNGKWVHNPHYKPGLAHVVKQDHRHPAHQMRDLMAWQKKLHEKYGSHPTGGKSHGKGKVSVKPKRGGDKHVHNAGKKDAVMILAGSYQEHERQKGAAMHKGFEMAVEGLGNAFIGAVNGGKAVADSLYRHRPTLSGGHASSSSSSGGSGAFKWYMEHVVHPGYTYHPLDEH